MKTQLTKQSKGLLDDAIKEIAPKTHNYEELLDALSLGMMITQVDTDGDGHSDILIGCADKAWQAIKEKHGLHEIPRHWIFTPIKAINSDGYVRQIVDGEFTDRWLLQITNEKSQHGFQLCSDDSTWDGGLGSGFDNWELLPASVVPVEVKEELQWILDGECIVPYDK